MITFWYRNGFWLVSTCVSLETFGVWQTNCPMARSLQFMTSGSDFCISVTNINTNIIILKYLLNVKNKMNWFGYIQKAIVQFTGLTTVRWALIAHRKWSDTGSNMYTLYIIRKNSWRGQFLEVGSRKVKVWRKIRILF